jgi:hypothetical protein
MDSSIERVSAKLVARSAVRLVERGVDARGTRKCVRAAQDFDGYVESNRKAHRAAMRDLLVRIVVI